LFLLICHPVIFAIAYYASYAIRFEGVLSASDRLLALRTMPWVIALQLLVFVLFGCHRSWNNSFAFADLLLLVKATTASVAALFVFATLYSTYSRVPRIPHAIYVLDWATVLLMVGGLKGSMRWAREQRAVASTGRRPRRALMLVASESCVALARAIHRQSDPNVQVVGFLSGTRALTNRLLAGYKVVGHPDDAAELAAQFDASIILASTPAISTKEIRALVDACHGSNLTVQVVPGFDALINGQVNVRPRDVDIHDLLCRDPVRLDNQALNNYLHGRVILVTGAAGSIGSEICRQILPFRPKQLILLDHNENGLFYIERDLRARTGDVELIPKIASITDAARVRATFEQYRPELVFHAAAHKHVPMMEANPGEAVKNNVLGTRIVADEAVRSGADSFVMISTDKAVNPTSVMGACKRVAEMYVQSLVDQTTTRLITVRFGNVLGSNGSVVPLFKQQIADGGPLTVTHPKMTRYFMTISEASQLVLQAGALGGGGEIFVLDMGEPVRIDDLARDLIRLSGLRHGKDIDIVYTGLRPGEKLYEELYQTQETRLPTPHPKIFSARHRPACFIEMNQNIARLEREVWENSADEVVETLQEIVGEYKAGRQACLASPRSE
jgi:FlaA1/EpsC-like NDP-sugar epimerase